MPMRGWNGDHQQFEAARVAAIKRYWASKRSEKRRKQQSELAKQLNKTMPKEVRAANGRKISARHKERIANLDPKVKAERVAQVQKKQLKRNRDFQKAQRILEPWGLTVEDNTKQRELNEIIEIFGI